MGDHQYYMLLASLPVLKRFDLAERLPISRERLMNRMAMLQPEDMVLLDYATDFFVWFRQSATRSDEAMAESYQRLADVLSKRQLEILFELPINLRTIIAALRRRYLDRGAPEAGEQWGVGPLAPHISRNWEATDFRLHAVYPWISDARTYIETGAARELERLLGNLLWKHFDRPAPEGPFGIGAITAYFFKWGVLNQWLSHDTAGALERFDELVAEVTDHWEDLFDGI
jgi:hypothetical protein